MRCEISFVFSPRDSLDMVVDTDPTDANSTASRKWLDDTWEQLGCEPVRLSGKVLLLDKILGVTDALGYTALSSDPARAQDLAWHIAHALGRWRVTVDLPERRGGY